MGWRVPTAREALHRIGPYDIANVEDPVGSIDEMARLRIHTRIPFSTHVPDLGSAARLDVTGLMSVTGCDTVVLLAVAA
jgi:glucarate dehydratase